MQRIDFWPKISCFVVEIGIMRGPFTFHLLAHRLISKLTQSAIYTNNGQFPIPDGLSGAPRLPYFSRPEISLTPAQPLWSCASHDRAIFARTGRAPHANGSQNLI